MKILHNPRCRKSRETLELIRNAGVEPEIILYLDDVPSKSELKAILTKLKLSPEQIVRKNEAIYKQQFKGKKMSDAEWIKALISYPKLIERPIVIKGKKAIVGRPPENVNSLL